MSKHSQYLVSLEFLLFSFCFTRLLVRLKRLGGRVVSTVASCGALRSGHGVFAHRVGSVLVVLILVKVYRIVARRCKR